jgi:uncharacterized membrane protein YfcA
MPALFPDIPTFIACALIMAAAQLIYATVGFGAGMFSVTLLAMVLPDLAQVVAVLLILTLVTEVWVLAHEWRHARVRLLAGLLPTMAIGLFVGTHILVAGNADVLKRALGLVVAAAGLWFLFERRTAAIPVDDAEKERARAEESASGRDSATKSRSRELWALPVGLASGVLGGMFGTGGPPVIVLLRSYRLDKGAFRATLLWYFMLMSLIRGGTYAWSGLISTDVLLAAAWLLPGSVLGIVIGMAVHRRVSERRFAQAVSLLLVILGVLLIVGVGR